MKRWAYVEAPGIWEDTIANAAGLGGNNNWRILVTVPDQKTGVPNEVAAPILKRQGSGYQIRSLFEEYPTLRDRLKENEHIPRGRIRVSLQIHV